jgi:hypothetical protein
LSDLTFDPALESSADSSGSPAIYVDAAPEAPAAVHWSFLTRLGFRAAFCYCLLYALCCGNATIFEPLPLHVGEFIEKWTSWPFRNGAQWAGQHLFQLTGIGAKLHGGGSGDRILDWIAVGVMLAVALTATLVWTLIAETRKPRALAYPKLFFWMRVILRVALGFAMLNYGLVKLFPLQMMPPSLAVLNEPLGNTSPMTMLWTLIGLSPVYQMICGAAECVAGVLLLFRRTTLVGTLLTVFLTTNIVLYNFCFDVPVKIYAAHLLLIALVLLAPSMRLLWDFFILHKPTAPIGGWTTPARRHGLRVETVVTAVLLALVVGEGASMMGPAYFAQRKAAAHPSPFTGEWHVDTALLNGQPKPVLTNDGYPLTDIYLEPIGRAMFRGADQALYRGGFSVDDKKHTARLGLNGNAFTYAMQQPDAAHLVLTPTGNDAKTTATLTLTRVPLPQHYPLLERGFHFVNEWGLER